jgi:hypothetical protein
MTIGGTAAPYIDQDSILLHKRKFIAVNDPVCQTGSRQTQRNDIRTVQQLIQFIHKVQFIQTVWFIGV